jgi:methyl-accepting chemotaxis protein
MKALSIKTRLILAALLSTLMIAVIGSLGLYEMKATNNALATIYADRVVPLKQLKIVADMYAVNIIDAHNKVDAGIFDANTAIAKMEEAQKIIHTQWKAYTATYLVEAEKLAVARIEPLMKEADMKVDKIINTIRSGKKIEISRMTAENYSVIDPVSNEISGLVDIQLEVAKAEYDKATANYNRMVKNTIILVVLAVLAGLIAAIMFARQLGRMLGGEPAQAQAIANTIANGDLNTDVTLKTGDSTSLLASMHKMQHSLRSLVWQIKESAEFISTGAQEISAGNTNLSQRTEEQASSLEETASSMEQMASTVKQNAENAKQANIMAVEASQVATKGGQVVSQVVSTMADINTSSKKIVDIISVIDGIAFQTNILALNAAVEAARAGEQGRGFAVVAAEVRSLAQRSATAAKEIKQLIGDSVEKVQNGSQLVAQAGETMDEIVMAVKMVTDIVNEIAAASQEQSAGIDQVNNAITNMDEVTQQNAALVEQAAAAASSLEAKAQALYDATDKFILAENRIQHQHLKAPNPEPAPELSTKSRNRLKAPKVKADEDWEEF